MAIGICKISTTVVTFSMLALCGCSNEHNSASLTNTTMAKQIKTTFCSDDCKAKNKSEKLSCRLTTPELQKRKQTVIASLKQQILDKKELKDGYAFKFPGTDNVLDEFTEFIKTERECCDFFTFGLSISGDKSEAWLGLTGVDGVKDFIISELELTE